MKSIVTASQISAMDNYAINQMQIPGTILMENAGIGIVNSALTLLNNPHSKCIHIYCGPGNNGGDGYVVARHLINKGALVKIFVLAKQSKIKGDAEINLGILEKMGGHVTFIDKIPHMPDNHPDLIVDAILGTGVKGPLRGLFADIVTFINSLHVPVLAVDIPTGVNADTGAVYGQAIKATKTTTMALIKRGLLFSPGRDLAGQLEIVDISMPNTVLIKHDPQVYQVESKDISPLLPERSLGAHKNACGTVATIAGSTGFTGAAVLASESVLRAGAGLSYLCIPKSLNAIFENKVTEVITWPLDDVGAGYLHSGCFQELFPILVDQKAIVIGPGLSQHKKTAELVHALLDKLEKPIVLDADGLNVCADQTDLIKDYKGEMILTPHPGEFARLTGLSREEIITNRIELAHEFAKEWHKVIVLKGGPTIIAMPDGPVFINSTGNAGMATAGSGDVLSGVIAALLAQGLAPESAALLGVYVHGLAGDLARHNLGELGLIASDIMNYLPVAFKTIKGVQ